MRSKKMSSARAIKRGLLKVVFYESINKFMRYRLSKRGLWIAENSDSAKRLSTKQINKLAINF